MMKQKLFTLFVALVATTALWAQNNVITYTAANKLYETTGGTWRPWSQQKRLPNGEPNGGLHIDAFGVDMISHEFSNGVGVITFAGDVKKIGEGAFYYCTGVTSVTIPSSVTTIEESAFCDCWKLTSMIIPYSVTLIEKYAFRSCNQLMSITIMLGSQLKKIENDAFDTYLNTINYYDNSITDILIAAVPNSVQLNLRDVYFKEISATTPSVIIVGSNIASSDINIRARWGIKVNDQILPATNTNEIQLIGLNPATKYDITLCVLYEGAIEWYELKRTLSITTPELTLTTLNPKVVSAGTAVVAAETNISDYETNVGFEWRKTDAPSTLPSKSGAAVVCNGMMEGRLLNLGTNAYWNVRPYYTAADGTSYYGEWITFDPSDFSYFEPTVHTYALATSPTSNSVQVRGYVMTGTDEVTEQGFEYWINSAKAPNRVSSATSEDVHRVKASGQLMTAVLENLAYSSTYTCRAYALAGGKTYYGEEVQFLTPENPTGLFDVLMNNDAQQATKFMHNGQLYILRDGNLFTATGARVK